MNLEVIGREAELASVRAFVERSGGGPAALALEGEAGIGKSTLWRAGVEHACAREMRVLAARPAEVETRLLYAGLSDLLEGVLDDVGPELSRPRRRALAGALLLDEADGSLDDRALAVAVRDALQLLAKHGPILVAVDDVQWLDPSSSSALAFALRRLDRDVRLLLARRLEPSELEQSIAGERLRVGPLSVGAVHRLLHDRLARAFPRQTLLRIHERSGGNPFYALEIARVVGAEVDPTQPLPVPASLVELVRGRVSGLPAATREALALAAAVGAPSEALLERVGVGSEALAPAVDAGVIERDDGTIRFSHPLLASAVYDAGVHARLAKVVDDPLARARHLALSSDLPDVEVARALDDAAQRATEWGASAVAAELSEHALRLTPAVEREDRRRRALATARAHQAAGEWTRAQAIARKLLGETGAGPERAEILDLLAQFEVDELAVSLLEEALADAATLPELQLRIRIRLALSRRFTSGFAAAFDEVRGALASAEELDDDALRVFALNAAAFLGRRTVHAREAQAYQARACEIANRSGDPELLKHSAVQLGQTLVYCGEYEAARASLERDYAEWRERDERLAGELLSSLAWLELWSGNFERAADCAARAHEVSIQYGVETHYAPLPGAWTAAYRGQLDRARELAERGVALCEEQLRTAGPLFPGVLGVVACWGGDTVSGVAQFAEADRLAFAVDWRNPHSRPWTPDYVEALLELGRIDDAIEVLDRWEADAARLERERVLAQVHRCRGLVAAARGEIEEALALLEQAAAEHEAVGDPFGCARALLALGSIRRRARRKREAREAIESALHGFETVGAVGWAERARAELGRIGGRRREQGLTAAERRVATLVSEGRTNREVAAALFLGERTVETHLSHVYAKLGVRSRAELARLYRPGPEIAGQSSGSSTSSS
jgi:DNA-binding CsgD family transcriptional regulator